MKKVGKLLLYIILSTCVVYFIISNLNDSGNVMMTVDFIKNGSETDVVNYSKQVENDFRKTLKADEEASKAENDNNKSETSEDKKDETKKDENVKDDSNKENNAKEEEKNTETKNEEEEKEYENISELAEDYPMGVVFYSMTMSRGEVQIETLCVSATYGLVIGIMIFMFSIKDPTKIKEGLIMYIIALVSAIVATELAQMVTLLLAYGTIYFVKIKIQYLLVITAIFLIMLAMKKTIKNDEKKMKEIKTEIKDKMNSKKKDRK